MTDEVIMLAKNYPYKKTVFPVSCSEKLDGTAAWFQVEKFKPGGIKAHSRQDKPYHSVQHIQEWLWNNYLPDNVRIVGELAVPGMPFKEASGIIRRNVTDERIVLNVYDWFEFDCPNMEYVDRMHNMYARVGKMCTGTSPVRLIPGKLCNNEAELNEHLSRFMQDNPEAEGVMIRPLRGKDSIYKFGRSWGLLRYKPWETEDLEVLSFEEGKGEHAGMVGRINVRYNGEVVGCGPGKMTHKEREHAWVFQAEYIGKTAEIQFKKDNTYDAMREPTFQRWRPDKDAA